MYLLEPFHQTHNVWADLAACLERPSTREQLAHRHSPEHLDLDQRQVLHKHLGAEGHEREILLGVKQGGRGCAFRLLSLYSSGVVDVLVKAVGWVRYDDGIKGLLAGTTNY